MISTLFTPLAALAADCDRDLAPSAPELTVKLEGAAARVLAAAQRASVPRLKRFEDLPPAEGLARVIGQRADLRRAVIETWRADELNRSRALARRLESGVIDPATQYYNIVFIGAGSAEVTAQLHLTRRGLNLKTLTIESEEVVARTFYDTRGFYLNSTDGPSASNARPLPDRGLNLNKIPGGFTQTSVVSTDRYAEAGVLGDVLNINRLLIPRPFLFGARVDSFRPVNAPGLPRSILTLRAGRQIYADVVFESTGLGTERITASSPEGRAYFEAEWDRFLAGGEIPRYLTAVRFFQLTKWLEHPYVPFVGKRILINGDRDFAKVTWEFFERGCPPSALKSDTAEVGRFGSGTWVGPNVPTSCQAFTASSRSRYLKSLPAALDKGRITPIVGRTIDVTPGPDGRPVATIETDSGLRRETFDFVIDAIGFAPPTAARSPLRDVTAELPDTGPAVVGREIYPGAYQIGVASGAPVTERELARNDENRASLFLNLVRVTATVDDALARYGATFGAYPPVPGREVRRTQNIAEVARVSVELVNPDGFVRNQGYAGETLDALMASALSRFEWIDGTRGGFSILAEAGGRRFIAEDFVEIVGGIPRLVARRDLARVVDELSATGTFFSLLGQWAEGETQLISWIFEFKDGALSLRRESNAASARATGPADRIVRGFATPAPVVGAAMPEAKRKEGSAGNSPAVTGTDKISEAEFERRVADEYILFKKFFSETTGDSAKILRASQIKNAFRDVTGRGFDTKNFYDAAGKKNVLEAIRTVLEKLGPIPPSRDPAVVESIYRELFVDNPSPAQVQRREDIFGIARALYPQRNLTFAEYKFRKAGNLLRELTDAIQVFLRSQTDEDPKLNGLSKSTPNS